MASEYTVEILKVITRVEGVKSFRLARPENFSFAPGQWLFVHLEINGTWQKKPLSFSSSPTEKGHIEFTKRITTSDFSKKLDALSVGETVKVGMPYRDFTFDGGSDKIALLSGGIGITPFRSICKNAVDRDLKADIVLLYGNSSPSNIIFKDELDDMAALSSRMRGIYTITSPYAPEKGWSGCTGVITGAMVKKEIPDHKERIFFLCGPTGMVECLISMLKNELGIPEQNIRRENFVGYA